MAIPTFAAAESLPKFLLPRLSWKATAPLASSTSRTICRDHQPKPWQQRASAASFHSAPSSRPRLAERKASPILRRAEFHTTAPRQRDHHFDTLKFVQRLESEGFTEDQSVAMMKVLNDVIEERYVPEPLSPAIYSLTYRPAASRT